MNIVIEKKCTKCGHLKLAKDFYKKKTNKDGLRYDCIECIKKYRLGRKSIDAEWRIKNRKSRSESHKRYREIHRDELINKKRMWNIKNGTKIKEYARKYSQELKNRKDSEIPYPKRQKCCDCGKIKSASRFQKQRAHINGLSYSCKDCNKKQREKNKQKIKAWGKKYASAHKLAINKYRREKRKNNLNYKITSNLRVRIYHAVKSQNVKKSQRTMRLIGCSIDFLKRHVESQFIKGMNWDNYGVDGWHIDHIRPCAMFDLTKENEQIKCFNYNNLQPLWGTDNLKKNSFYNGKLIRKVGISTK